MYNNHENCNSLHLKSEKVIFNYLAIGKILKTSFMIWVTQNGQTTFFIDRNCLYSVTLQSSIMLLNWKLHFCKHWSK